MVVVRRLSVRPSVRLSVCNGSTLANEYVLGKIFKRIISYVFKLGHAKLQRPKNIF